MCAIQQGLDPEERERKVKGFDVFNDTLAQAISNKNMVTMDMCLAHPLARKLFKAYCEEKKPDVVMSLKCMKSIMSYKERLLVPTKAKAKADKIFKKYITKGKITVDEATKNEVHASMQDLHFLPVQLFQPIQDILDGALGPVFAEYKSSADFEELEKNMGPKMLVVNGPDIKGEEFALQPGTTVTVGRSDTVDICLEN